MTVELPLAPVDALIRRRNDDLRVSSGAAERLAHQIQRHGASISAVAAERAERDGRKTIMADDYDFEVGDVDDDDVELPIAPVDRIARLDVEDYRVSQEARVALTAYLERWGERAADAAGRLATHADRKTVQDEDVAVYFEICPDGSGE